MSDEQSQRFPPQVLRDYALVADGERGALLGPRGEVAWLCAPGWDSPAVFCGLMSGAGTYAVTPVDEAVWAGYYEAGTLIWRNRWMTNQTVVECRDALRLPADRHHLVLLRRVEATDADVSVRVVLDARAGFGEHPMREVSRADDGVWTARTGELYLRWSGAAGAVRDAAGALRLDLTVAAGAGHDLVLEIGDRPLPALEPPQRSWEETEHGWTAAVPRLDRSVAPRDTRHAYAVLRGLTRPGGGMVAAATMGLPERAEAGRNYDYRYVWMRDQALAGIAAAVDEPLPLLDDAVAFTTARLLEDGDRLRPAYRLDGGAVPDQQVLDLPGYPGAKPVAGNHANDQFQLDALGELLQLFAAAARHDHLDTDGHRAVRVNVAAIEKRWLDDDNGIWELQTDWWAHSRLACVAGLRTIGDWLPSAEGARVAGLADAILAETSRRCVSPGGGWSRSTHHSGPDAALLLPPVRGALSASDPRSVATLDDISAQLTSDGYVYRFVHGDRPLGAAEGAFLVCGFWMALAQWQRGDLGSAHRWFERQRGSCGPPGILTEEYNVRLRQPRGNLPQGFVHAALLEASQRLATDPPRAA